MEGVTGILDNKVGRGMQSDRAEHITLVVRKAEENAREGQDEYKQRELVKLQMS